MAAVGNHLDRCAGHALGNGAIAPEIAGENWINSKPLTIAALKGRVVLVDFWTYG